MKKITFPQKVKRGSVVIKIYRTPSHGCDSYTLSYHQDGVRKRPTFPDYDLAKAEAEMVANQLGNADADVLTLTSADRAAWAQANDVSAEALKAADARARERLVKAKAKGRLRAGQFTPGAQTATEEGWSGFAWRHNALRHPFISCRVAEIQNVNQVAPEAGNSARLISRH